jgi:CRISPR-associated protein Csb2
MAELERLFAAGQWLPHTLQQRYKRVDEQSLSAEPSRGVFSEMIVFRRAEGLQLTVEAALTLSTALRAALVKLADEQGTMTDLLHGHGRNPHCAFVPLPFAGYPHADGRLMGVAVVLPRDVDAEERRRVLATAGRLEFIHLPKDLGVWRVELADVEPLARTLRVETWVQEATRWSTVTPILLDQFPKQKANRPGVEQILAASCERVGFPAPTAVEHGPYSRLEGVPPVPQFRLLRHDADRPRWGVHATLTFDRTIRGPMLLGAGRYFGLGLLRPNSSEAMA